jgi:hypothetical protein
MGEPVIRYVPRGDVTPEEERETLARIYAYVLQADEGKRATKTCGEAAHCPGSERRPPNPQDPSQEHIGS